MTVFVPKKIISNESCGEKLRNARVNKRWSLTDIAKHLSIKEEYLKALEENRLDLLPAGLYGKNFIKKYAHLLQLNCQEILIDWESQSKEDIENPFSRKVIKKQKFIIFPRLIKNILIILAVSICFFYLIFYFRKVISPPKTQIIYPETSISLSATNLTISGLTEPEAEVRINGEIVLNNNDGYFEQNVNLKKGLNNIVIKTKKKYSQEETITRQILVE